MHADVLTCDRPPMDQILTRVMSLKVQPDEVLVRLFLDLYLSPSGQSVLTGMAPALQRLLAWAVATHLHRGSHPVRRRVRAAIDRHAPGLLGRVLLDLMKGPQ